MGQVGPEDAASNFAKWAKFWGISAPAWLHNPSIDLWITAAGGILLAVGIAGLLLWLRRSRRDRAPHTEGTKQVTLAQEAEDIANRINMLGATYALWMPDAAGYQRHNDMANHHYMREYREEIATKAQLTLERAKQQGTLAPQDILFLHQPIAERRGVEELGRALLRIVAAAKPHEEIAGPKRSVIEAGSARSIKAVEQPGPTVRMYAQISVTTTGNETVRNCQAHLTHVSKLENGVWKQIFNDDLLCLWSMLNSPTADLFPGLERHLNVASAKLKLHTVELRPELQAVPHALLHELADHTIYRFHISITGDNVAMPCRIGVNVDATHPKNWKVKAS
jgi:hypothetical protein